MNDFGFREEKSRLIIFLVVVNMTIMRIFTILSFMFLLGREPNNCTIMNFLIRILWSCFMCIAKFCFALRDTNILKRKYAKSGKNTSKLAWYITLKRIFVLIFASKQKMWVFHYSRKKFVTKVFVERSFFSWLYCL